MPRIILVVGLPVVLAFGSIWACGDKSSPVEPTPIPACTFTLSTVALSIGAGGGTGAVTVTTGASCAWTAASDRGWMHVDSGASMTGPGTVSVSLTANTAASPRAGTLTVAGQAVSVTQDPEVVCAISLSTASASFSKDAAVGTFTVTAPGACTWHVSTTDAWITVTSGNDGRGTAAVAYSIPRNSSVDTRTGAIHVDAAVFSIVQQGDTPAPACDFHVAPVQVSACMSVGHELATMITTLPSCGWTATSDTPWISVSVPASRNGPGELRFSIGDNYDAPRLGVVKVRWDTPTAGQNVQVSQAGCRYGVSTAAIDAPAAGGAFTFDVYQESDPLECGGPLQDGCVWSAQTSAAWITIGGTMPRRGDDRVSISVAANGGAARSSTITVRDKTIAVRQAGS